MKQVDLTTLKGGVVIDMFNEEMQKVLANIADENVKPDEERKITIELSIKPDKTRSTAATKIIVHSKLAKVRPSEGLLFFEVGSDGRREVFENDVRQPLLDGIDEPNIYKMPEKAAAGGTK